MIPVPRILFISASEAGSFLQETGMSNSTGIWIKAALLLLAGAWQCDALAAPAAATAGDVEQITVHFGDLNIDQPKGAVVLYRRIRHAAERVCGEPQLPGSRVVSLA